MDTIDYNPDILEREAAAREKITPPMPQMPAPEMEAIQQMLSEAYNRELILRTEIVRLRRLMPQGGV